MLILADNTIFDDVFRTMLEKMPRLIIPVINEVFQTSYSEHEHIEQYRNEHHTKSGEIITDSYFGIGSMLYHIECQSTHDSHMCIRMIEYDFAIDLEDVKKKGTLYEMNFPHSCVLYLRQHHSLPEELQVKVNLPDETSFIYKVPVIKVQEYTKDEIFQKRLLFFLPFYIMRYENDLKEISQDPCKISELVSEFQSIQCQLRNALSPEEETDLYRRILELMKQVSDYLLEKIPEPTLKERIGDTMGGKVLELETDKLIERSIEQGIEQGIEQATVNFVTRMLKQDMSIEDIILYTGCNQDDVLRIKDQLEKTNDAASSLSDDVSPVHKPSKSR